MHPKTVTFENFLGCCALTNQNQEIWQMRAHVILINALSAMPPKSSKRKRIIQLLNARNSKRNKTVSSTNEPEFTQEEVTSLNDYQSSQYEWYEPSIEDMEEDAAV